MYSGIWGYQKWYFVTRYLDPELVEFRCEEPGCGYIAGDGRTLTRHMRQHSEELPFACGQCSYRTRLAQTFRAHMKKHHSDDLGGADSPPAAVSKSKIHFQIKNQVKNNQTEI